ncbi:MAG TPA: hypothetical protein DFS52_30710 [Myxococcales bacterium]|nr:hypothetical protein [Myxococcales bacterium]
MVEEFISTVDRHPQEWFENIVREMWKRAGWPGRERLASLGVEKDIAGANQLLVQLGMSKKAVTRQVCNLSDGTTRARFLVRHDLQPLVCRTQDAPFDADTTLKVRQRVVQNSRSLDLPIDAIDVPTCIPEDLQDLVPEAHGLNPSLPRRVYGLFEAASRELRLDDGFGGRLRVFYVEVEEAQVEIAGLGRWPENRATRRMEGIEQESELERVPLGRALAVDRGVLLAKWTACVCIVAKACEQLVEHPLMTRWRRIDAGRDVHGGKDGP